MPASPPLVAFAASGGKHAFPESASSARKRQSSARRSRAAPTRSRHPAWNRGGGKICSGQCDHWEGRSQPGYFYPFFPPVCFFFSAEEKHKEPEARKGSFPLQAPSLDGRFFKQVSTSSRAANPVVVGEKTEQFRNGSFAFLQLR